MFNHPDIFEVLPIPTFKEPTITSTFPSTVPSISIYKSPGEALSHPKLREPMIGEITALHANVLRILFLFIQVNLCWLWLDLCNQVGSNYYVVRLKARLVAKGYTQILCLDFK